MAITNVAAVSEQVQKFWAPMFMDELRATQVLSTLVNKDYDGEIKDEGDTVYVSQINAPQGENRTVGTDAEAFATEQMSTTRVSVVANKRAVAAFEFTDLAKLQSQIKSKDSDIRKALVYSVGAQINRYLYSLVAPSSSSPDHILNSVSTFDGSALLNVRKLGSTAKWNKAKPWITVMDPVYYNHILAATPMVSSDYVNDAPTIGGQVVTKRYGFDLIEDNSLASSQALSFHPDFLLLCAQTSVNFKVSDLHPNKKFGFVISADIVYGASLGITGSKKHILTNASSSASAIVMA